MNRIEIKGNVGSDPELKYTANQTPLVELSIADSEKRGEEFVTQWVQVTAFGKTAERVHTFVKKGNKLSVTGKLHVNSYKDKEGKTKTKYSVIMQTFDILMPMRSPDSKPEYAPNQNPEQFGDY